MLADLMNLNIFCNIWLVGSEFGVNDMKAWIHPALYQQFGMVVMV